MGGLRTPGSVGSGGVRQGRSFGRQTTLIPAMSGRSVVARADFRYSQGSTGR